MYFKWEGLGTKDLWGLAEQRGGREGGKAIKRKEWCAEIRILPVLLARPPELAPAASWSFPSQQAPLGGCGGQPFPTAPTAKVPSFQQHPLPWEPEQETYLFLLLSDLLTTLSNDRTEQGAEWPGKGVWEHSLQNPRTQADNRGTGVELETRGEWTAPGHIRVSGVLLGWCFMLIKSDDH